jgi:cell fate (sporulation/competence/biofilm development) regulator YlbF (YheA/YmcA/DUF963 family)
MIEVTIREAADEFVRVLAADPVVTAFKKAKGSMEGDETLAALRDQHAQMAEQFQRKQVDGTLAQEDIARLRTLYNQVTTHPANLRFVEARDDALELLRNCNEAMSNLLGFDFAANAAPAASC